jgi:ubiquinone/menaquinone biosynthesis C-methylase UbiE
LLSTPASLYDSRLDAARATKGMSSSVIYRLVLAAASELVKPDDQLLEFGAGAGTLVGLLRQSGFHGLLTGADIMSKPESIGSDVRWIEGDLNEPLPIADASFDCIISTEVI